MSRDEHVGPGTFIVGLVLHEKKKKYALCRCAVRVCLWGALSSAIYGFTLVISHFTLGK